MKSRRLFALALLIAASCAFAGAAAAADADAAAVSKPAPATTRTASERTMQASRTLWVKSDRSERQHEGDEFLIALRERAAALGAERAGLAKRTLGEWFTSEHYSDGLLLRVDLSGLAPPPPPVAAEIADELVEFTRTHVQSMHDREHQQDLTRAERQVKAAQRPAGEAEDQLKAARQRLRELAARSDVSHKTLTGALSSIDDEVQRLQLEQLAKEARRKAIEEEIAGAAQRVQKSVEGDAIAGELKKVVEARDERVKTIRKMYEQGVASSEEITNTIAQAAEARAKLLQHQRDTAAAAGGAALEAFNRELMTLSIDARELETKIKYLEARLPRLREAVELLDEHQAIEVRAHEARDALRNAQRDFESTRRAMEASTPPRVLVKESVNAPYP